MGFTSAGLANGGQTAHYQIAYDETFSRADGLNRAAQLMDQCEFDFDLMNGWFGSPGFKYSFPIAVNIANATGGAIWSGGYQFPFSEAATVTINPGTGTSTAFIRYLLVTEVVEMFMDTIDNGWFQGSDEGSKGEGLSRFLGHEFLVARVGNVRFPLFELVPGWLNSPTRSLVGLNAIDTAPDDRQPDLTNGCTTCFVYFLRYQLGFSIEKIIQAGASTLAGVFKNLTGRTDASQSFFKVVNTFYPQGFLYNPAGDRLFPVANLATFDDFQIQANQTWQARILTLDTQALAEVNVTLVSDNPMLIQVPNLITFQPGTWNIGFNITAADVVGPAQTVQVHASYARKTLTSNVTITPRSSVLQGQVTDVASRPIADATVFITSDIPFWLGGDELQLSTDANGFYQTPALPPHTYQVSASQSGYVTSQVSVRA